MMGISAGKAKLLTDAVGGLAMGLGYTTGAYTGYGAWNTSDPFGLHQAKKTYSRPQYASIGMTYGMSGYGRYRYRRYSRFRRYRRYRRRSYWYRRRRYY